MIEQHHVVGETGDLELGAHTVGGRDEHGVRGAAGVEGEHATEAADATKDTGDRCARHRVLDSIDRLITCSDVDACGCIGRR